MDEAMALQITEKAGSKPYIYKGSDPAWENLQGTFEALHDMNCCAPTDSVLFAFNAGSKRKVMSAAQLIEFYDCCVPADEAER